MENLHKPAEVDTGGKEEPSRISFASILELLDPVASKVTSKDYPFKLRLKDRERERIKDGERYINEFSTRTTHFRHRTKQNYRHLKNKLADGAAQKFRPIDDVRNKVMIRIKSLDEPLQNVFFKNTSGLEKLFYPFTLFNIFSIGIIMGKFPKYFHIYYTLLLSLLMPIRFYTYYKRQNHYFLADLCYFVNFLCLVFIWGFPQSRNLFQSCFALTFGSLSFAVITWRNSLVIHSIDKTTSCFIHIIPPLTMYVIYFAIPEDYKLQRFPGAIKSTLNLKSNIIWTSFYYLIWQLLYHYFITLKKSTKIRSGQRMTSFEYLTTHQFKNFWAVKLNSPWPMVIYTVMQYFYQLCTMLLCSVWLRYKFAAQCFLVFIFLAASHNGATYYVDVYGKSFERQVNQLKEEVEILQAQLNTRNENELVPKLSNSDAISVGSENEIESTVSSLK